MTGDRSACVARAEDFSGTCLPCARAGEECQWDEQILRRDANATAELRAQCVTRSAASSSWKT